MKTVIPNQDRTMSHKHIYADNRLLLICG